MGDCGRLRQFRPRIPAPIPRAAILVSWRLGRNRSSRQGVIIDMPATTSLLRDLHRMHQQLRDLRDRLERGPKQVKARETGVARLEAELEQAKAAVKAVRMACDQKQLSLKSSEGKIADLKVKLNQASTNREYQALRDQIAADEMANSVLADEILEAMEKIDETAAGVAPAEERLAKGRADLAVAQKQVADQHDSLMQDVSRIEAELVETEKALPGDFREAYLRIVRSKGSEALAQVDGGICQGCYQQITPNNQNSLVMGAIVMCGSCGRMLYLPEDRSPSRSE